MNYGLNEERSARRKSKSPVPTKTPEELQIEDLIDLCKGGDLFAVQDWIAAGKPVNRPFKRKGVKPFTPLRVATEIGFHSLVKVLLDAGADFEPGIHNRPLWIALDCKRLDLIRLFIEYGDDLTGLRVNDVFETWDVELIDFLIEAGLDVETGFPLVFALESRIRPALTIYLKHRDRFPTFRDQANIALRRHFSKGDSKWSSLLLWAGADPYSTCAPDYDRPDEEDISAIRYAALYGHFELFKSNRTWLKADHPDVFAILESAAGTSDWPWILKLLTKVGVKINDQSNGGCSAIDAWLNRISLPTKVDHAGRAISAIEALVKAGAQWCPTDTRTMIASRRGLSFAGPSRIRQLVQLMTKNKAALGGSVQTLLDTPKMRAILSRDK